MSWVAFIPTFLVAVVVLAVPGGALAYLLRLRGLWLAAAAAPLSISLIAVAAIVSPWVGVGWGPIPVIVLTLVAGVGAYCWSRWVGRPVPKRARSRNLTRWLIPLIAVLIPAVVIAHILVQSIGQPEFLSQRYDNFFHLNAVQYVIDTGNASPLWIGTMTSPGGLPFYPSGWHAFVSLIVMTSGASVVAATNAAIIAVAALVWPVGAVLLVRSIAGVGRVLTVAAGVASAAFPAFPFLPLHYGVLYPLFLGLACVPFGLAVLYRALRPHARPRRHDYWLLVVLTIPGLGVAHPGALLALLALSVPFVVARAVMGLRMADLRGRTIWGAALAGYVVAGLVTLAVVRPPASQIYWPVIATIPQAIGEVFSAAVYQYPIAWVIAGSMIVGAYSIIRRPSYSRWIVLSMAVVGAVLYCVVAASTSETLRLWLTAPWYNNAPRLASIWAIATLPLAAVGLTSAARFAVRVFVPIRLRRASNRHSVLVLFVAAMILVLATQGAAIRQAAADIEFTYELRDGGPILSPGEYELMEQLPFLVPKDAVIAGDPWTGTSFAYGISGRKVLMPHLLMDETPSAHVINTRLADDGDSPDVCAALKQTGVRYVLDFDAGGDFQDNPGGYEGLRDLENSPFVKLVAEDPGAQLYQITSCGLGS